MPGEENAPVPLSSPSGVCSGFSDLEGEDPGVLTRPPLAEQLEQVGHVRVAVASDVAGIGAPAGEHIEQICDIHVAVAIDVFGARG